MINLAAHYQNMMMDVHGDKPWETIDSVMFFLDFISLQEKEGDG